MADISQKFSEELTYSDAIAKVMQDNGGFAPLKLIYKNISKYKKETGKTPNKTIQERVQRDKRFTRIAYGVYALTDFLLQNEIKNTENIDIVEDKVTSKDNFQIEATERKRLQNVRIGQEQFREKLLNEFKRCPITKIDNQKLLIASHIKPWSYSNDFEKLDPKNGLLLSPLFDKLFDKDIGLITITPEKRILISPNLSKENIQRISIVNFQIIEDLPIKGREKYLEYHNEYIFQK